MLSLKLREALPVPWTVRNQCISIGFRAFSGFSGSGRWRRISMPNLPNAVKLIEKQWFCIGGDKTPLYCRSGNLECAYFLGSEHIAFQRLDNIRHYWEAKIVNVYNSLAKSTTFQRKLASSCRMTRGERGKGRVLSYSWQLTVDRKRTGTDRLGPGIYTLVAQGPRRI